MNKILEKWKLVYIESKTPKSINKLCTFLCLILTIDLGFTSHAKTTICFDKHFLQKYQHYSTHLKFHRFWLGSVYAKEQRKTLCTTIDSRLNICYPSCITFTTTIFCLINMNYHSVNWSQCCYKWFIDIVISY